MTVVDPRLQRQQARTDRQNLRAQNRGPATTGTYGTGGTAAGQAPTSRPPAAAPPQGGATPPGPAKQGQYGQGPYGYQGATSYASQQSDQGTQYERDVLGGKYLTPESNPYLSKYADDVSRRYQGNLARGLSQVSSPFASGATLGQTGIHADVRGRYFNEGMQDLGGQISKLYADEYGRERGLQQQTSQDLSNRTQNLRNISSQNYATDLGAKTQIQTARINAQSQLQQARMAQALGYDQLAADAFFKYEQLNQQATQMEQDWILRSGGFQADVLRNFSGESGTGQAGGGNTAANVIGGAIGGAATGYGAYDLWRNRNTGGG